ncbi:RNA polymerase subunit sigma-70 [Actinomadura sp. 6N118]|uniref:RNA polymerase subunit sigma-70 n=1 Tax=Actinomadura sp. 6N118 TaxID=3375151 RepID=UPI0037AD2DAA
MSGPDTTEFEWLLCRHRAEIQLHCYRMLGSLEDAEDLTQEAFLRAWRARDTFIGRSSFRTWIYRIATNACLDHLRRQSRQRHPAVAAAEFTQVPVQVAVPWLQPYPDPSDTGLVDLPAAVPVSTEPGPEQQASARDTVRLAFVAAIQYLPHRQRGAFLLRDCLGWSVQQCAEALESSSAAVNSALQRARATMRTVLDGDPARWTSPRPGDMSSEEWALVERYVDAVESADDSRIAALFAAEARVSHAPQAGGNQTDEAVWYGGRQTIVEAWHPVLHADGHPELRLTAVRMNAQPGLAAYVRMPGQVDYEAFALNALTVVAGQVTEVATFPAALFTWFGLPRRRR